MAKSYFNPADEPGKRSWLNNFAAKLPTYAATVGVTAAEVTQTTADATYFSFVVEAATNLANLVWIPVATNTLADGTNYFSDPQSSNHPARFYRLRSP